MYCSKCGKEVADGTAFCPSCGNKIDSSKSGNFPKMKPLTEKDYHIHYVVFCLLTTLWLVFFGFHHIYEAIEKYNGNGLDYIYNRGFAQLFGAFIAMTGFGIYGVYKRKIQIQLWKILTAIISSVISQLLCFVGSFFYFVNNVIGVTNLTDIEQFERLRSNITAWLVLLSIIYAVFSYMLYRQKCMGVRTKTQEVLSGVMLSTSVAVIETFMIWKMLL